MNAVKFKLSPGRTKETTVSTVRKHHHKDQFARDHVYNTMSRLSESDLLDILFLHDQGESDQQIATRYNLTNAGVVYLARHACKGYELNTIHLYDDD